MDYQNGKAWLVSTISSTSPFVVTFKTLEMDYGSDFPMRFVMILLLLLVFLAGALFTSVNTLPVTVDYYIGTIELALSVALLGALVLGLIIGVLVGALMSIKHRKLLRRKTREVKKLEQELDNLRGLPVRDGAVSVAGK
ncbi:MAG TPA: hypothetical protein DCF45_13155 [Gammaproteobacteria bacterium]|nr:hypothetical protein [Gammaproteobacteria bacterium]